MTLFAFPRRPDPRPSRPAGLAGFEQLEDRWTPSTLSVRSLLGVAGGGDPGHPTAAYQFSTMTPGGGDPGAR